MTVSQESLLLTEFTGTLLAVVSVDRENRVRCGQPSCGHSIYRRIHVVREEGQLLVLGSTCFEKRYGGPSGLCPAHHGGGGGEGRLLTDEERQLLLTNTQALIAQFEEEAAVAAQAKALKAHVAPNPDHHRNPVKPAMPLAPHHETPWAWVKPWSSVFYVKLQDGTAWMRVQRRDDKHMLMPWPIFDGWDEALPPLVGAVDAEHGGFELADVVAALKYLRAHADWEARPGSWKDVMAEISAHR